MLLITICTLLEAKGTIAATKQEISDYLEEMVEVFNDRVYRVSKDGGYCCIVIGNEVVNGTLQPLPHILLSKLVKPFGNWNLHEEIIWHKVTGGINSTVRL